MYPCCVITEWPSLGHVDVGHMDVVPCGARGLWCHVGHVDVVPCGAHIGDGRCVYVHIYVMVGVHVCTCQACNNKRDPCFLVHNRRSNALSVSYLCQLISFTLIKL